MTKLRGVALTLVFGGIAAALVPAFGLAGAPEVPVVGRPVAAVATTTDAKAASDKAQVDKPKQAAQQPKTSAAPSRTAQGGQEPNINERKKQANDELRENKLVVGGAAFVLLLIVIAGRRMRKKRKTEG